MQRKVLRGNFAQSLLADWARSLAMADIRNTDIPKGLSQELPAEADIRTQRLRETGHEVFYHRSVVVNLSAGGCGVRRLLLFQLLDLSPNALVGAERLLEGSALQASLLNRPHNPLRLPAELGKLAPQSPGLRLELVR